MCSRLSNLTTMRSHLLAVTSALNTPQAAIGYSGLYFLFASLTVASAAFVFLAVPETKGKTPEQMRKHFDQ